jgi:hypothetical protein
MASSVRDNYQIFKNALVYTVTFRTVSTITAHGNGSTIVLVAMAFMATTMLQRAEVQARSAIQDNVGRPFVELFVFGVSTLVQVGVHMQSNLIGLYVSDMFKNDMEPLYIFVTSAVGLVLIWVLGVALGCEDL